MPEFVFAGNREQFFAALLQKTVPEDQQSFFVTLDEQLVCRISGDRFWIWPRSRVSAPVIVGTAIAQGNTTYVRWRHRLPLAYWYGYAIILLGTAGVGHIGGLSFSAVSIICMICLIKLLCRPRYERMAAILSGLSETR